MTLQRKDVCVCVREREKERVCVYFCMGGPCLGVRLWELVK